MKFKQKICNFCRWHFNVLTNYVNVQIRKQILGLYVSHLQFIFAVNFSLIFSTSRDFRFASIRGAIVLLVWRSSRHNVGRSSNALHVHSFCRSHCKKSEPHKNIYIHDTTKLADPSPFGSPEVRGSAALLWRGAHFILERNRTSSLAPGNNGDRY